MSIARVFEVRFEQIAQHGTRGRFSIPSKVVELLDVDDKSDILIETSSHKGLRFITTRLKSGNEIYGGLDEFFDPGELISVRVTKLTHGE